MPGPANPHDALFKRVFSEPRLAARLIQTALPPAVAARLDWASLCVEPASFVDDRLGDRHADLLFSARLTDSRPAFVYLLLEHQSGSDGLMAFRMLRYVVRIWESYLREHPDEKSLPIVVPLIVHHSESGWSGPTSLAELLDADAELVEALGAHLPQLRVLVDDLSSADDAALRRRCAGEALALGALRLLVWARRSSDLLADLRRWQPELEAVLAAANGVAALSALIEYILRVSPIPLDDLRDYVQHLGPTADEAFMTGAQQLIEKGIEKGMAQLVLRQLDAKFGPLDEATRERVAAASVDELDRYAERILDAKTLEDVIG